MNADLSPDLVADGEGKEAASLPSLSVETTSRSKKKNPAPKKKRLRKKNRAEPLVEDEMDDLLGPLTSSLVSPFLTNVIR